MKYILLAVTTIMALGGGHGLALAQPPLIDQSTQQQGSRPAVSIDTTARIGEEIYAAFRYREVERMTRFVLEQEVRGRFFLSNVVVPSGTLLVETTPGFYCSQDKLYIDPIAGPWRPVCFQDQDNNLKFDRFGVRPGSIWLWKSPNNMSVPFKIDDTKQVTLADGGYKKELIFQGVEDEMLKVTYREFLNDNSQPTSTQELTYPISNGVADISFREVEIKVNSVNATTVNFRLISGGL